MSLCIECGIVYSGCSWPRWWRQSDGMPDRTQVRIESRMCGWNHSLSIGKCLCCIFYAVNPIQLQDGQNKYLNIQYRLQIFIFHFIQISFNNLSISNLPCMVMKNFFFSSRLKWKTSTSATCSWKTARRTFIPVVHIWSKGFTPS